MHEKEYIKDYWFDNADYSDCIYNNSFVLADDTIGVAHVTAQFLLFFVVYVTFQSANRQKIKGR